MTDVRTSKPDRVFTALPIDGTRGFPQSFPFLFNGATYHFWLYVNVPSERLDNTTVKMKLPEVDRHKAHLAIRVQIEQGDGTRSTIFMRKIVPGLIYETESIILTFDNCTVAVKNLGGVGDYGSSVTGGIAARWE